MPGEIVQEKEEGCGFTRSEFRGKTGKYTDVSYQVSSISAHGVERRLPTW